jgi:hypothetical protein
MKNRLLLSLVVMVAVPALGQSALPNAPSPHVPVSIPGPPPVHASHPNPPSKWDGMVDPGQMVPTLTTSDKMLFWLHEEVRPMSWAPTFLSAGWEQLIDGHPKYGSDSAAFGERLGAAALREASGRFFSDSLLPVVTHEDPRYYRKAHGSIKERGLYAAERVFVSQRDDGSSGFNYSQTFGNLGAAALAVTYYPDPSTNAEAVLIAWMWSFAGSAGGNLFLEFWPDARDAIFHRHRHAERQP